MQLRGNSRAAGWGVLLTYLNPHRIPSIYFKLLSLEIQTAGLWSLTLTCCSCPSVSLKSKAKEDEAHKSRGGGFYLASPCLSSVGYPFKGVREELSVLKRRQPTGSPNP